MQEWDYLKKRPQEYNVEAFHIVAYLTFVFKNIGEEYIIEDCAYTTNTRILGMKYIEFDSPDGKIGRWIHPKNNEL